MPLIVNALKEYFGGPFEFHGIYESTMERFKRTMPEITEYTEDRDNWDYVYDREKLATLSGRKYHSKKNHYNAFIKEHPDYVYEEINAANKDECIAFGKAWCAQRAETDPTIKCEACAIEEGLNNMEFLKIRGGLIRLDGQVKAFTFGEKVSEHTAVVHVEKADPNVRGLFTAINKDFVQNAWPDVQFINREEDMGKEGLRKAKESYNPIFMVKKYNTIIRYGRWSMDFRLINEKTLPQVAALWDECFEKKGTPFYEWYFSEYALKQNKMLGGFEDHRLMTMVHLNPYTIHVRNKDFRVPYLVGVATAPEARGRHVMGELMDKTFTMLRAMKVPFVVLMPIHAGIYLPYGFSFTALRTQYELPLREIDLVGESLTGYTFHRISTKEAEALLAPVYDDAMAAYTGYVKRNHQEWENLLGSGSREGLETVVLKNGEKTCGYALYQKGEGIITIQELMALAPAAKLELLRYFRGFYGTFEKLSYLGPCDDLLYLRLSSQQLAPRMVPFMMGRIVNAAQVLQSLSVPDCLVGRELVIGIRDEQVPLNTMLVKMHFDEKGITLFNTLDDPTVLMDISSLTQLFFGTYGARELKDAGFIHVEEESSLWTLETLFPKKVNFINEYF